MGKVNIGFQTQVWRNNDHPAGAKRPWKAGHVADLAPVLNGDDHATAAWFLNALGWWNEATGETNGWDDAGGETVCALFVAALSHHGRPLQLEGDRPANPPIWKPYVSLDPREQVRHIGELAREWFPAAFTPDAPPLPSAPAFQHMFAGLCTLADWIGSNEDFFPYCGAPQADYIDRAREQARRAVNAIGLDLTKQRREFAGVPDFETLFSRVPGAAPRAIQRAAALDAPLEDPIVIIESETGSGKTEAALWRFARMYEARAGGRPLLRAPHPRRRQATPRARRGVRQRRMFAQERPPVVLAVPNYDAGAHADRAALPGAQRRVPRARPRRASRGRPSAPSASSPPRSPSEPSTRR